MTKAPRAPSAKRTNTLAMLLSLLAAMACGPMSPTYTLSKTAASVAPKPVGCQFEIVTTQVDKPYEEVGILDAVVVPYAASNAGELKEAVSKQVCEVGGDAVFAEVNGHGRYVRGTIVRWKAP